MTILETLFAKYGEWLINLAITDLLAVVFLCVGIVLACLNHLNKQPKVTLIQKADNLLLTAFGIIIFNILAIPVACLGVCFIFLVP